MATKIAFQLVPLERASFDLSQLPFSIMPNVEIADVSELLPPSMFDYLRADAGLHRLRFFETRLKRALVHRYDDPPDAPTYDEALGIAKTNDELLNEVFACSRGWRRPLVLEVCVSPFIADVHL